MDERLFTILAVKYIELILDLKKKSWWCVLYIKMNITHIVMHNIYLYTSIRKIINKYTIGGIYI